MFNELEYLINHLGGDLSTLCVDMATLKVDASSSFNPRDFFGVANSSKVEIDNYLK